MQAYVRPEGPLRVWLDEGAYPPVRAHADDAGLDLRTPVAFTIGAGESAFVSTGVHVELPPGHCGMVVSRSGLNRDKGITSTGLIDPCYTGSIGVTLHNHSNMAHGFEAGDKVSQLVVLPCAMQPIEIVDGPTFESERGSDSFGSTGA